MMGGGGGGGAFSWWRLGLSVGADRPRCVPIFLVWEVWPYRGLPGMSYMLILSDRELWITWLFLYRFFRERQGLRGLLLAVLGCPC